MMVIKGAGPGGVSKTREWMQIGGEVCRRECNMRKGEKAAASTRTQKSPRLGTIVEKERKSSRAEEKRSVQDDIDPLLLRSGILDQPN
jgi:hypothetical protein